MYTKYMYLYALNVHTVNVCYGVFITVRPPPKVCHTPLLSPVGIFATFSPRRARKLSKRASATKTTETTAKMLQKTEND